MVTEKAMTTAKMRNFVTTADFDLSELEQIVETAIELKQGKRNSQCLSGKILALVFFNPSLRTRVSMQVAVQQLGGQVVILEPGTSSWSLEHREGVVMDEGKTEHLKEFIGVLERYTDGIGVRCFAELKNWEEERLDPVLSAFLRYATKPIINLESAFYHPCQAMADIMTIREIFGKQRKKILLTWAWHPKPLPMAVPNSFALIAAQFGHNLRIAYPKGYELDGQLMEKVTQLSKQAGGSIEICNSVEEAFDEVDVVYAKSWGSSNFYGDAEGELRYRAEFRDVWIVDENKMRKTNDAIFMHCLPVRRNVVVTDAVLDSASSVIFQEAENKLHVQKAILTRIFDDEIS